MKKFTIIFVIIMVCVTIWVFFGCGETIETPNITPQDTEIFILDVPDLQYPKNPCDKAHEIQLNWGESNLIVDWGNKNCRYFMITGFGAFHDPRVVIFGFRSDGVVVWRFEKEEKR